MEALRPLEFTAAMVRTYSLPGSSPVTENSAFGELEVLARTLGVVLLALALAIGVASSPWLTDSVKVCGRPPSHPDWQRTDADDRPISDTVQLWTGSGTATFWERGSQGQNTTRVDLAHSRLSAGKLVTRSEHHQGRPDSFTAECGEVEVLTSRPVAHRGPIDTSCHVMTLLTQVAM